MRDSPPSHPCAHLLKDMPSLPGVYQMYNAAEQVIYIGKARDLRKRVASYFKRNQEYAKTRALMRQVQHISVTVTPNEQEALLLEANLIKQHKPHYNILLRDDKSFPYIYLDTSHAFPRLDFYRGSRQSAGRYFGPYPNVAAVREMLAWIQKLFKLRQCSNHFFSHRSRPCLQYHIKRCTAPCVALVSAEDYALQVQQAVCMLDGKRDQLMQLLSDSMQSASATQDYEQAAMLRDQIQKLRALESSPTVAGARGDVDVIALALEAEHAAVNVLMVRAGHMVGAQTFFPKIPAATVTATTAAADEVLSAFVTQYYAAPERRDNLPHKILLDRDLVDAKFLQQALTQLCGEELKLEHKARGLSAKWLHMAQTNVVLALQQRLQQQHVFAEQFDALQKALQLPNKINLIECFDISHTQGEATIASCVVCGVQGMQRSDYRRFNIAAQTISPGDDYAAMRQAILRRYTRQKREAKALPDLLLIDGGRGQLKQAEEVLESLQISGVVLLAIAKGVTRKPGAERLFLAGAAEAIRLPEQSAALHVLQRIRDEAHRFAITGHRKARGRTRLQSKLQDIPGVGAEKRQALLTFFSGIQGVKQASVEQLTQVPGIGPILARTIYDYLRKHCP